MKGYDKLRQKMFKDRQTFIDEQGDYWAVGSMENYTGAVKGIAIDKLADLENKIENGTLVELPCKVGDKFYYVEKLWQKGWFRWEVLEYIITGIFIKGSIVILYVENDEDIYGKEFTMWVKADGTFEFDELVEDYCFLTKPKQKQN